MLAEEHLVFKFSSIDPGVKCLEIVASVNVAKVTVGVHGSRMNGRHPFIWQKVRPMSPCKSSWI